MQTVDTLTCVVSLAVRLGGSSFGSACHAAAARLETKLLQAAVVRVSVQAVDVV